MIVSFRTRLFVVSTLIVGAALASVMVAGWSSLLSVEVERLDARLCMEARRVATQPWHENDLPDLESDMLGKLHLTSVDQIMIAYDAADGDPGSPLGQWNYRSHENDDFDIDGLNWAKASAFRTFEPSEAEHRRTANRHEQRDRPLPRDCSLAHFSAFGQQWHAALFQRPNARGFVAADLAATKGELQGALQGALTVVIPLALLLTALGAWLLASFTMRPVNRLRNAMKNVSGKALDKRLPNSAEDREFRELIDAYNTMLARLEANFQQASRFSSDAAHELKTPLTILQGRLEQAIGKSEKREIQVELTGMLDEVGRLAAITRKLLLLSQADAGQLALHITHVDLTEMLDGLLSDAQMLVTDQKISASIERYLVAEGDAILLRQLFNNLISNAVRYSTPEGSIRVKARRLATGIEVLFANESEVISTEDRQRFFQRFYRGDPAHHRKIEGNGLGLSLALEIARAHGGDLTLEPSAYAEVKLRLCLPVF
jgi:heavy metal sensor kinase